MSKIDEARQILKDMGLPKAQYNEISGLILLAILNIEKEGKWADSKKRNIRIHDIIKFIEEKYGKTYAENTRETVRRQVLHQFEQAGIVDKNIDDPNRPTNSPNTVYMISDEALDTIRCYGTKKWVDSINEFKEKMGSLRDIYEKRKTSHSVSVLLPDKKSIILSPGKHNELQSKVIQDFIPHFSPNAQVLYVGDTAKKTLHVETETLSKLNVPITEHDKLPDIVLYDSDKNLLYLIEVVTVHGPVSPKRQFELEEILSKCKAKKIYISTFPDFHEFKRHADKIAWETEIWIANNPDHMIHFNGSKFCTAYQ